ncbi:hypothetical protein [Brevundimonas subvibrioides]|uniref:Uncharacterized protein n=1 Tax=Brevundimonas subvibrioides (strain ATCC 15264 / DSM 4735 / LMG 14903 / NBRC 16000 / CB 81) TaxID=633149 RepID=D9QNY0_BRESC|nr:hypothetical protein [Brevundimonas subvibrioides]ADL00413.1 hypothetical protein Bresu_1101 [Brevundimonas subvibrioides ATCC 15264]
MTPKQITAAFFAMASTSLATAAAADSASFTITVTIPPFAEAISARQSGAAGDWTVLTSAGGFLVNLPETVEPATSADAAADSAVVASAPLAVYRSDRNRFTLSVAGEGGDVAMTPSGTVAGANLVQVNYLLPTPVSTQSAATPLQVVFAGL